MIVDLLRNDMARVCQPGSVKVPGLFKVETHTTLHQMISLIKGQLRPDTTFSARNPTAKWRHLASVAASCRGFFARHP